MGRLGDRPHNFLASYRVGAAAYESHVTTVSVTVKRSQQMNAFAERTAYRYGHQGIISSCLVLLSAHRLARLSSTVYIAAAPAP